MKLEVEELLSQGVGLLEKVIDLEGQLAEITQERDLLKRCYQRLTGLKWEPQWRRCEAAQAQAEREGK